MDNKKDQNDNYHKVMGLLPKDDVFDEAEHAQWQQLRELSYIQAKASRLNAPETHPDFDGTHCVECGEEIPEKRLKIHKVRCIDCQTDLEKQESIRKRTYYK